MLVSPILGLKHPLCLSEWQPTAVTTQMNALYKVLMFL